MQLADQKTAVDFSIFYPQQKACTCEMWEVNQTVVTARALQIRIFAVETVTRIGGNTANGSGAPKVRKCVGLSVLTVLFGIFLLEQPSRFIPHQTQRFRSTTAPAVAGSFCMYA